MTAIRLEGLSKSFGKGPPILSNLTFEVGETERLAIVGPSGAGKTTLLRLLAGFEKPGTGKIFLNDREVTNLPPEQRDIGFVFQNHALYPHLTVQENLEFPLRLRNVARAEIAKRVGEISTLLQLQSLLRRRPAELSGGEAQRVALGRAVIRNPAALLMDEPLSSLPPDLRRQLRHELIELHAQRKCPMLYVTHEHEDALALGQRVAILHEGRFQQIGTAREIYDRPANRFVAGFVGKPSMNFLKALSISRAGQSVPIIGIRPEHFEICDAKDAWCAATIEHIEFGGPHTDFVVRSKEDQIVIRRYGPQCLKIGDSIHLCAAAENVHFFDSSGNRVDS
jgi:ABC-type sugar transport system ATPase subunit